PILDEGGALLDSVLASLSLENVTLKKHGVPLAEAHKRLQGPYSLILMGNVLNEIPPSELRKGALLGFLFENAGEGGVLMLEPAFRESAHHLSQARDMILRELPDLRIW